MVSEKRISAEISAELNTKIEVLRVQMGVVEKSVSEGREETRRWREEMMASAIVSQNVFDARFAKHELADDHRHAVEDTALARLENQILEAGKMVVTRLETLEKGAVAVAAVESYRRRMIAMMLALAASLIAHVPSVLRWLMAATP